MLRDKIQKKIGKAFDKALSDAVSGFSCSKKISGGTFNPATQKWSIEMDLSYSGRGVLFGSYEKSLVKPADYQVCDCRAIILQNEVSGAPEIGDVWATGDGKYQIISGGFDPAKVSYEFQIRKVA